MKRLLLWSAGFIVPALLLATDAPAQPQITPDMIRNTCQSKLPRPMPHCPKTYLPRCIRSIACTDGRTGRRSSICTQWVCRRFGA